MAIFLFSVFTITEAKQAIGMAEPGRWIFQPGHLTWRALM